MILDSNGKIVKEIKDVYNNSVLRVRDNNYNINYPHQGMSMKEFKWVRTNNVIGVSGSARYIWVPDYTTGTNYYNGNNSQPFYFDLMAGGSIRPIMLNAIDAYGYSAAVATSCSFYGVPGNYFAIAIFDDRRNISYYKLVDGVSSGIITESWTTWNGGGVTTCPIHVTLVCLVPSGPNISEANSILTIQTYPRGYA